MRLLPMLFGISIAALVFDASVGTDDIAWCAQLETGGSACGLKTQARCLQAVRVAGGTCVRDRNATSAEALGTPAPVSASVAVAEVEAD